MNRLRDGYCIVPHTMKPQVVSRVSLTAEDVDAIVFWTKHPGSLLPHLDEITSRGYRFMFLHTVTPYGPPLETQLPPLEERIQLFQEVSRRIGADRVVWRYDPIVISNRTDEPFHLDNFEKLSARLEGFTRTVIVSFVDFYGFVTRRLAGLRKYDLEVLSPEETAARAVPLAEGLREIASRHAIEIQSCAEERDLQKAEISPGSCIDGQRLQRIFGGTFPTKKDPGQRKECLCAISKDIGVYDTCGHQCVYCYATRNLDLAAQRCASHNPSALSLVGHLRSDGNN